MSRHKNAVQNHGIMTANKSFEKCFKVQTFGYSSNKLKLYSRWN